ncbi:radical SAM protein [Mycolicibacterium iranicum]|uniref:radical SAM protein n=1 Tax=Mycolicibacterium iranicum TaxID=912594 RepID=UPI000A168EB5|nr:radical SAM protein [Mycolicibacterium iranicum]
MSSAVIYRTNSCNLRCIHCSVGPDLSSRRAGLSLSQFKTSLDNLARNGTTRVTILGGEPLSDPLLYPILEHAGAVGIAVTYNTNLTLKTIDFAKLASYSAFSGFIVSIDGGRADIHDKVRGRVGAFSRTLNNISLYNQARAQSTTRPELEVNFVLSGVNACSIGDLFRLCEDNLVDVLGVTPVHFTGFASDNREDLDADLFGRRLAIEQVILYKYFSRRMRIRIDTPPRVVRYMKERYGLTIERSKPACPGTGVYSYVDLKGNHLPCPAMAYENGPKSLFEHRAPSADITTENYSIRENLLLSAFDQQRSTHNLLQRMEPCRSCEFNRECFPCVADLMRGAEDGTTETCRIFSSANLSSPLAPKPTSVSINKEASCS